MIDRFILIFYPETMGGRWRQLCWWDNFAETVVDIYFPQLLLSCTWLLIVGCPSVSIHSWLRKAGFPPSQSRCPNQDKQYQPMGAHPQGLFLSQTNKSVVSGKNSWSYTPTSELDEFTDADMRTSICTLNISEPFLLKNWIHREYDSSF